MTLPRISALSLATALILALPPPAARSNVVINEIMYHPPSDDEEQEWLELFNAGPTTVVLTGWHLSGAINYTFPDGEAIGPGDYLVVARSVAAFHALYTTSTARVIGDFAGHLSNGGETIALYDGSAQLVDLVAYDDEGFWPKQADGDGSSLELVNPHLDNSIAQSWAASSPMGTPGLPNSRLLADPPPFLVSPKHAPAVPRTTDTIRITVYAFDDSAITSVGLFYRLDPSTGPFTWVAMQDDGLHGDGAPADGIYGATLPPQPQGTIVEFWIRAADDSLQTTDIPTSAPQANFLLQVDDQQFTSPTYRIVMKEADHRWLHERDIWSNELVNATFIFGEEIYYNVGVRLRGKGSRRPNRIRKSYRVQFSEQQPFHGIENLNLNAQWIRCQYLDMDLCRRAGIPAPQTKFIYLVFKYKDKNTYYSYNGDPPSEPDLPTMGWRIQMQDINKKFLRQWFPGHSGGNLYRGYYCSFSRQADFTYYGTDKDDYRCPYEKKTNKAEDDYSDIIQLCDVFTNTPDTSFTQVIQQYIDVDQWMRFWSCLAAINIEETNPYNTRGDDYYLYFDPATSPPFPKALLLPWDLDEANLNPTESIFVCQLQNVKRFCENPDFTPKYFYNIQRLLDYYYTLDIMLDKIDSTAPYAGFETPPAAGLNRDTLTIDELNNYVTQRIAFLETVISRRLTVEVSDATKAGDEYITLSPVVTLSGRGLTALTRWVTVDGNDAGYDHLTGNWGDYALNLSPGLNIATVECLTTAGVSIATETVRINYVTAPNNVCGTLPSDTTWTHANGPYFVTCDLVVPDGVVLTIEPGTNVLLNPGCSIFVYGNLSAQGSSWQRIAFAGTGGSPVTLIAPGSTWKYNDTGQDLGTAWRELAYDDSAWSSGPAQLGYGDGDEATVISYGPDPGAKYPCYYFRHRFLVANPPGAGQLTLRVLRDDGCVVYLNGTEIARSNMPAGQITYDTWAVNTVGSAEEDNWYEFSVDASLLRAGENVVAVEVHQHTPTSSDVSFDLELLMPEGGTWGVIAFDGADATARLSFCDFQGGSADSNGSAIYRGVISVVDSTVELNNCRFEGFAANAIDARDGIGSVAVSNCVFAGGSGECIHSEGYPLSVQSSTFTLQTHQAGAAIYLRGQGAANSAIRNSRFAGGANHSVILDDTSATVEYNTFSDVPHAALFLSTGSRCTAHHNVFYDGGVGLLVANNAFAAFDHNTVYGFTTAVACLSYPTGAAGGGEADLTNSIIWSCTTPIAVDSFSTATVRFCDIEGGWPGPGNFDLDPLFVNAAQRDFHIRPGSPCKNAGEGGTYVGAFPVVWEGSEVHYWRYY